MQRKLTLSLVPIALLVAPPVFAAEPCADGTWFCDEEADAALPEEVEAEAEPEEAPPAPFVIDTAAPPAHPTATQTPDEHRVIDGGVGRKRQREQSKDAPHFGLNLRLNSVLMEKSRDTDRKAGLGGVGLGVRFMPAPFVAFEPSIDGVSGRDALGRQRSETTLGLNTIFFLNPDDPIQIYGLMGVFTTTATVKSTTGEPLEHRGRYSYVGGQVGAGAELRLGPALAFNADIVGFSRQRNERQMASESSAELRRDSAGGLFRAGMSLYF